MVLNQHMPVQRTRRFADGYGCELPSDQVVVGGHMWYLISICPYSAQDDLQTVTAANCLRTKVWWEGICGT